jgi:hypothetical protein
MYQSVMQERGRVDFPGFQAERHYMIPFFQKYGLPPAIRHWQPTVDAMLSGIHTDQPIYFMADQSFVKAGEPQRRPGVHVDGYWHPEKLAHGGGGHRGYGGHLPRGRHRGRGHGGSHMSSGWDDIDFSEPEALILASDVSASQAYIGAYEGSIGEGGECSSICLDGLDPIRLKDHTVYCGTVATLHESLPVSVDSYRTLVRLNCPGVTIQ